MRSYIDSVVQVGFYKVFGRPIAKVFLGAVFTYQATYWLWAKLEKDDIQAQKEGIVPRTMTDSILSLQAIEEILSLERQLGELSNRSQ